MRQSSFRVAAAQCAAAAALLLFAGCFASAPRSESSLMPPLPVQPFSGHWALLADDKRQTASWVGQSAGRQTAFDPAALEQLRSEVSQAFHVAISNLGIA